MRHSYFFTAISFAVLGLSGCGMEDTGSSAHNPATNVDLTFSTFDLANTETVLDNLEHTRFWDFYQGIQPSGKDDTLLNRQTATEIRDHIDKFIQAVRAEDASHYEKVRNPLDLMNQVIASNQVNNFQEGRKYISQRIASGEAATYNSRGNGALIRFTDQLAALEDAPLNQKQWVFPTLDWRYQPEGNSLEDKVYRTVQYVSRSVEPEDADAQPELLSVLAGSRFSANEFKASGYNRPEYATADYVSRNFGGIELRQSFIEEKTDTLYIKSADKKVLDLTHHGVTSPSDSSPDCLRVDLDYVSSTVRIFSSDGEPATISSPTAEDPENTIDNGEYCGHQEDGDAEITWQAVGSSERQ